MSSMQRKNEGEEPRDGREVTSRRIDENLAGHPLSPLKKGIAARC